VVIRGQAAEVERDVVADQETAPFAHDRGEHQAHELLVRPDDEPAVACIRPDDGQFARRDGFRAVRESGLDEPATVMG
jgi:hypothetical protein